MSVTKFGTHAEIFKFKSTGALPLFDEVIEFVRNEHVDHGRRWQVKDIYSTPNTFAVRLEEI